jgi:hypothetical protein
MTPEPPTENNSEDMHMKRYTVILSMLIALAGVSLSYAGEQRNVYDVFRQFEQAGDSAAIDKQVTALIKRHMANLLYPVDMGSFERPEKDEKFLGLIKILQKQMGVPTTGTLTFDEFNRLEGAASDLDSRFIGAELNKNFYRSSDGEFVSASGVGAKTDKTDPLALPINITRIVCQRRVGTCELNTAEFSPEESQLHFPTPFEYSITTWEPARITALLENPCATEVMSIDIKTEAVGISSVPHGDLPFCAKQGPTNWTLLDDAFPVLFKIHQDKLNAARSLAYEPRQEILIPK